MNYEEWSSLKIGDRVKNSACGAGIIISDVWIGYVVKFDNGKVKRISVGSLWKIFY